MTDKKDDGGDDDHKKIRSYDGIYFEFRGFKIAIGATVIVALMTFAFSHFH